MTDRPFLDRYRAGEHVAVWRELAALGPAVREAPVLDDARAVARETMRRVRHNVELLVVRLHALDFRFVDPAQAHEPPTPALLARLDALESEAGPLPLALRAFYEEVGSVCLMGSHPRLSSYAEQPHLSSATDLVRSALAEHPSPTDEASAPLELPLGAPPEYAALFAQLPPATRRMLEESMAMIRSLQRRMLDVHAESERIMTEGAVPSAAWHDHMALAGTLGARMTAAQEAATASPSLVSDPLVVWPPERDHLSYYQEFHEPDDAPEVDQDALDAIPAGAWTGRYAIDIAPDLHHKANESGGGSYRIAFPDHGADAPVLELGAPSFVEYLRECCRWGGFPGLAERRDPPREVLRQLTDGLLPF